MKSILSLTKTETDGWTVNILKGPTHCLNLHGSIFVIFIVQSETKSAQQILF